MNILYSWQKMKELLRTTCKKVGAWAKKASSKRVDHNENSKKR